MLLLLWFSVWWEVMNAMVWVSTPPSTSPDASARLVLLPGAGVPTEAYAGLVDTLTERAASTYSLRLWVAVPAPTVGPWILPWEVGSRLERGLQAIRQAGGPATGPWYAAGHSLGGAMLQLWHGPWGEDCRGWILLGAVRGRGWRNDTFAGPVLTVAGTLDTRLRPTRVAEEAFRWPEDAVVMVPGMTHFQFANGSREDRPAPERSLEAAHAAVADVVASFCAEGAPAEAARRSTAEWLRPLVRAYHEEGSRYFGTVGQKGGAEGHRCRPVCPGEGSSSPWAMEAQRLMLDPGTVAVVEARYADLLWIPSPRPEVGVRPDGVLWVRAVLEADWDELDAVDASLAPTSARTLDTRLIRGATEPGADACARINQRSYEWALANADATTRERFLRMGKPLAFAVPDAVCDTEASWLAHGLRWRADASVMWVVAAAYRRGSEHACTLLSPARATEWIYSDGLLRGL